jgi:hypothetical protein
MAQPKLYLYRKVIWCDLITRDLSKLHKILGAVKAVCDLKDCDLSYRDESQGILKGEVSLYR